MFKINTDLKKIIHDIERYIRFVVRATILSEIHRSFFESDSFFSKYITQKKLLSHKMSLLMQSDRILFE